MYGVIHLKQQFSNVSLLKEPPEMLVKNVDSRIASEIMICKFGVNPQFVYIFR